MKTLLFAALLAAISDPSAQHEHPPQLGKLAFDSSCSRPAHALLEQGLGWLHSFEYGDAALIFARAAAADPSCAIAYWGVAMSYYHPLWAPPTPAELEKGRDAVAMAKAAGARTQRERDYIEAIDAFYRDSDSVGHEKRALAYSAAMGRLQARYPEDREAAVLHALSLIATGTMDKDPAFTKEKQAAAILNQVLAINADHPGVAHYLIHGFDYPPLADLALPAARRYAAIAPHSAHAQHMPSHIFTRLGLWDESIKSNLKSQAAARTLDQRLHAMDYLAYAYLQEGQDREAERVLEDLNGIRSDGPTIFTSAYAATAIPARLKLERRQWAEAATLDLSDSVSGLARLSDHEWARAHIRFARAVGAARSGNVTQARDEVARLREIEQALSVPSGAYDWKTQVRIEREIAEAWLAHAEGRTDEGADRMRAVADLDDATEKHPVTPGAILPAREQLGDLLLELGRPAEALAAYEASLKRAPRRLAGLYGAARAAKLAGDRVKSARYFIELAAVTKAGEGSRVEIREARTFAAAVAAR